jgi:predicted transcriptional regulator
MTSNKEERTDLSKYCKETCGLDAKEVADYANLPRRTFYDWWKSRKDVVRLMVKGIKAEKNTEKQ